MAFAPFITRIYGPEAFGLLGTFIAVVAVATPIAALGYPIAIVLSKSERDASTLVRLSIYLSLGISLATAALLWAGGEWLMSTLGAESIASYVLLIPLAMLFATWVQIAQQWLIRKKQFSVIARNAVAHSLILNSAKSGIGWFYPGGAILIAIATVGNALHTGMLFLGARKLYKVEKPDVSGSSPPGLKDLALRHRDFPLYRAPQNLINAASQSIPVFMLAAFFGPIAAGYYTLANMVMGIPSGLVGKAVSDVFYPKIAEANHRGENLHSQIAKATRALLVLGVLPFGLIVLLGPWLFGAIFGANWTAAGDYARCLSLFFLFNFINKPAVAAVPVLGIQRGLLIYEVCSTVGKVFGLVAGFYWLGSDIWAIALFSLSGVISYSLMILWIMQHAKNLNYAKTS